LSLVASGLEAVTVAEDELLVLVEDLLPPVALPIIARTTNPEK